MRIDVILDTVCPWCYIGKHRFERALAQRPHMRAEIHWRPFLLNPEMPPEGMDRDVYLERKFGSSYRIQRVHGAAALAGAVEKIPFNFDAIRRTPNSRNSHRLIQFAAASGNPSEVVEAIFAAYFVHGLDIGDTDILLGIAHACGLPVRKAAAYLADTAGAATIDSENLRVHRLGVSGVPCFIFDGRYALAGAQEPDLLVRMMDIALESEPEIAVS